MPAVNGRVRAVLGDGDLLAREGVAGILEAAAGVEVVASVGDAGALRARLSSEPGPTSSSPIPASQPWGGGEGLEIAEMLDAYYPGMGLLALSGHNDPGPPSRSFETVRRVAGTCSSTASPCRRLAARCGRSRCGTLVDPLVIQAVVAAQTRP